MVNITQSQALAGAPWNMGPATVKYTNFALLAGVCFSLLTADPLSDWGLDGRDGEEPRDQRARDAAARADCCRCRGG
jgi:hypothetical protein